MDKDFLIVYFVDGEVLFRDDASGESPYTGHDWSEGDDKLVLFGKALDLERAFKHGHGEKNQAWIRITD